MEWESTDSSPTHANNNVPIWSQKFGARGSKSLIASSVSLELPPTQAQLQQQSGQIFLNPLLFKMHQPLPSRSPSLRSPISLSAASSPSPPITPTSALSSKSQSKRSSASSTASQTQSQSQSEAATLSSVSLSSVSMQIQTSADAAPQPQTHSGQSQQQHQQKQPTHTQTHTLAQPQPQPTITAFSSSSVFAAAGAESLYSSSSSLFSGPSLAPMDTAADSTAAASASASAAASHSAAANSQSHTHTHGHTHAHTQGHAGHQRTVSFSSSATILGKQPVTQLLASAPPVVYHPRKDTEAQAQPQTQNTSTTSTSSGTALDRVVSPPGKHTHTHSHTQSSAGVSGLAWLNFGKEVGGVVSQAVNVARAAAESSKKQTTEAHAPLHPGIEHANKRRTMPDLSKHLSALSTAGSQVMRS